MTTNKLYIDGEWVGGSGGAEDPTFDPATEDVSPTGARAEAADVGAAVAAARRAFAAPAWRDLTPRDRAALLFRLADLVDAHTDELARLETVDQGQPLGISRQVSVPMTADHFLYYAGWVPMIDGEVDPVSVRVTCNNTHLAPRCASSLITDSVFTRSC